jgi:hypothetical protein
MVSRIRSDGAPVGFKLPSYDYLPGNDSLPEPIDRLPSHVEAPDGQVSLFADASDARDGSIRLYLTNRTAEDLSLYVKGNSLPIRLEAQGPEQRWERAQAHWSDTCGTGSAFLLLRRGLFIRFLGTWPDQGVEKLVRFRHFLGPELLSNPIRARVRPGEILFTRYDDAGMTEAEETALLGMARGKLGLSLEERAELEAFVSSLASEEAVAAYVARQQRVMTEIEERSAARGRESFFPRIHEAMRSRPLQIENPPKAWLKLVKRRARRELVRRGIPWEASPKSRSESGPRPQVRSFREIDSFLRTVTSFSQSRARAARQNALPGRQSDG